MNLQSKGKNQWTDIHLLLSSIFTLTPLHWLKQVTELYRTTSKNILGTLGWGRRFESGNLESAFRCFLASHYTSEEGVIKSQRHFVEWKGDWKTGEQTMDACLRNLQSNLTSLSPTAFNLSQSPNLIRHYQLFCCYFFKVKMSLRVFHPGCEGSKYWTKGRTTDAQDLVPLRTDNYSIGMFNILSLSDHPTNFYWTITMCQSIPGI